MNLQSNCIGVSYVISCYQAIIIDFFLNVWSIFKSVINNDILSQDWQVLF